MRIRNRVDRRQLGLHREREEQCIEKAKTLAYDDKGPHIVCDGDA